MTYFIQSGDTFTPTPGKDSMLDGLPIGNFIVVKTMNGYIFQRVDSFDDPGRMYGNITKLSERIIRTFIDRPRTTGVLLSGEKGSGKSQLARLVSRLGYENDMPTILINSPLSGDEFNKLLGSIEQPAIILMDEFEKVYSETEMQEAVLTLLDGVMTSKKLFVLTVNNKWKVNDHMKNRPGRLYYSIEFNGLEVEFIREYCADNLDNQDETENIVKISAFFKAFNFDMLKALVEEINRYGETAFEAIELLNAKPIETNKSAVYDVVATSKSGVQSDVVETKDIALSGGGNDPYSRSDRTTLTFNFPKVFDDFAKWSKELDIHEEDLKEGYSSKGLVIRTEDLRKIDVDAGMYEYAVGDFIVVFQRRSDEPTNRFPTYLS